MKKIKILAIIILMITAVIILRTKVEASTGTVNSDTVRVRKEPNTSSTILTQLDQNDEVEILELADGWYKVQFEEDGETITGYISETLLDVEEEPQENETETPPAETTEEPVVEPTEQPEEQVPPENTDIPVEVPTIEIEEQVEYTLQQEVAIRILPLINSNVLENISSGATVTIITSTNKWTFVETDTISGWILNSALEENTTSTSDNQTTGNTDNGNTNNTSSSENNDTTNQSSDTMYDTAVTKYINGSSVYIRNEPSTDASIVISLIRNTDVTVTGENGDWYKVKYGDFEGYIFKELLSDEQTEQTNRHMPLEETTNLQENVEQTSNSNESSLGQEIVEYAKQYLGYPYVYGGAGSSSFDCSGFTMYVYKNFGYSLSHSARAQSKMGTYVEKENLQPGDLVFFLDYETMDDIGHCGIYIGDGNFIHASSGTGYCVKISTLLSGSYDRRYATARRLI